jgi:DNA-binding MarR family transcriptional regulator/GNAT superfamily N-acetyltransferase
MALRDGTLEQQVSAIREFNRFYTARLGLLRRRHLDDDFSLTEARILYEVGAAPGLTASALRATLGLDAGYVSRILALLTRRKLVRQTASKEDGRVKLLGLTRTGAKVEARLSEKSSREMQGVLSGIGATERRVLLESLSTIRSLLSEPGAGDVRIVQLSRPNDDALRLIQEYYQDVGVVQRDSPEIGTQGIDDLQSGVWLAYLDGRAVGCVVLRRIPSIPFAAECKRLYVQPAARGRRIAGMLLDAQEAFARSAGQRWIYLDSFDELEVAVALYERRGFTTCERYNDNPQATVFLRKQIEPRP